MNLQISIPKKEPCENKCPFCVVKTHKQFNEDSLPLNEWAKKLMEFLDENGKIIDRVVITGENEVTQTWAQLGYVIEAIAIANKRGLIVEFITTGSSLMWAVANDLAFSEALKGVDVLSISTLGSVALDKLFIRGRDFNLNNALNYYKVKNPMGIIRFTVLETRMFTKKHLGKLLEDYPDAEITIKKLQGGEVNRWIHEHEGSFVSNNLITRKDYPSKKRGSFVVVLYQNREIWIDQNCQDSEGRYYIFRGDGKIYNDWGDKS